MTDRLPSADRAASVFYSLGRMRGKVRHVLSREGQERLAREIARRPDLAPALERQLATTVAQLQAVRKAVREAAERAEASSTAEPEEDEDEPVSWSFRTHQHGAWSGAADLPYDVDPLAQILTQGKRGMTLEEVGACIGVTRERVRQIEQTALGAWREGMAAEGWTEDEILDYLAERSRRVCG